jgi:hypothetical protein
MNIWATPSPIARCCALSRSSSSNVEGPVRRGDLRYRDRSRKARTKPPEGRMPRSRTGDERLTGSLGLFRFERCDDASHLASIQDGRLGSSTCRYERGCVGRNLGADRRMPRGGPDVTLRLQPQHRVWRALSMTLSKPRSRAEHGLPSPRQLAPSRRTCRGPRQPKDLRGPRTFAASLLWCAPPQCAFIRPPTIRMQNRWR